MSANEQLTTTAPVGRDSVEPQLEQSEASAASVSSGITPRQEACFARASYVGKWDSTESHPTASRRSLVLAQSWVPFSVSQREPAGVRQSALCAAQAFSLLSSELATRRVESKQLTA